MRYLTTYLDDEINFKFGNNGSIIELKAVDDHAVMSFSNEEKLLIRIKNEESYIKTVPVTAERKIIQLPTRLLKDLTVGQYDVELWQGEGDNQIIYPDEGFLRLKIHGNASQIDGSLVSSITLADFEEKFNQLAKNIEDKLDKLPDIDGKNINVDVKVVDGNLWISGKDTGINLTAKDGRDGRDGHTPEITVSNVGTLVIDGVDTNKSLIGPKGDIGEPGKNGQDGKSGYQIAIDNGFQGSESEWLQSLHGKDGAQGTPGRDGQNGRDGIDGKEGKSAYQVAVDNGFDGTEVEWLRSLHGNDGVDGRTGAAGHDGAPGQNGKSAYEIAVANGFTGTEIEWLNSLKGADGHDGKNADIDLSQYPTKDEIANKYAQKSELPRITLDIDQRTLTINDKEINIPDAVDLSNYAQKSELPKIVFNTENNKLTINGSEVKIPRDTDLSAYYTKAEIDEKITAVQSGGKIDLSNYVTKQDISEYAKKTDIPTIPDAPDLAPYETKEHAEHTYATKEELSTIQLTPGKDGAQGQPGKDGIDGKNGRDGKSAYQIWLDAGNRGTEQDFLNSLKGATGQDGQNGKDGINGKSAYELWLNNGNAGTEQDFLNSLKGQNGANGADGHDGKDGQNGESAYEIWKELGNNGTEQDFIKSLKGDKGADGHDGVSGSDGRPGKDGINGAKGENGQSAYQLWLSKGNEGDENAFLDSLKGKDGAKGDKGDPGERGPKGDPGQIPDISDIKKGINDAQQGLAQVRARMSSMFVNILDFGAQPENVNFDNAPAFNKAIQALPSVGGTIFIPNGNYFLKSTVNIDRSYVHVMGLNHGLRSGIDPVDGSTQAGGGGAKVTVQNPITAFKLENTHNSNRLSGITFSGFDLRGDTNAGVGIDGVSNTDRVVIDNMTINNVGIGVRLHAADAPRITNSWIAETQSSILLTGASQQAEIKNNSLGAQPKGTTIYMENPDRFNISGNNIYPDGASAIRILNPVHGSIVGNTISAYYNGMIEFLPNSDGVFGNGNVISGNVIALESWHNNPDGKDNKWGIVHVQAFNNVIAGNNILANGTPTNTTGILVMKGDYNRISSNVITIQDTNSKVVINGAANNNWVIYSTEGSAFQDGGNQSNKNIGI